MNTGLKFISNTTLFQVYIRINVDKNIMIINEKVEEKLTDRNMGMNGSY